MTKIQDIIDFARQTGIADADFTATFTPEHIALMEAAISSIAPDEYTMTEYTITCPWCGYDVLDGHNPTCEWMLLDTYRKERGLDGTE